MYAVKPVVMMKCDTEYGDQSKFWDLGVSEFRGQKQIEKSLIEYPCRNIELSVETLLDEIKPAVTEI